MCVFFEIMMLTSKVINMSSVQGDELHSIWCEIMWKKNWRPKVKHLWKAKHAYPTDTTFSLTYFFEESLCWSLCVHGYFIANIILQFTHSELSFQCKNSFHTRQKDFYH